MKLFVFLALTLVPLYSMGDEPLPTTQNVVITPGGESSPVIMPPPSAAAPVVPTFGQVAACTINSLPGSIGKCVADPGKIPPLDSRSFWMSFGAGMGTSVVVPVVTWLVTHYLPPEPVR